MSGAKKRPRVPADPFFDVENVVSANECTGLMPAQVEAPEQGEELSELESIHRIHASHAETK